MPISLSLAGRARVVKGNEVSVKSDCELCRFVVFFPHPSPVLPSPRLPPSSTLFACRSEVLQELRLLLMRSQEQERRSVEVQELQSPFFTWCGLSVFTV